MQGQSLQNTDFIGIRTLDFRFRQGIQALETHLLLPDDLVASDAELGAVPKSTRLSLGWIGRIVLESSL